MKQFEGWALFFTGEAIGRYAETFEAAIHRQGPEVRLSQSWATDLKRHLRQFRKGCKFFGLPATEESYIEIQGHFRNGNLPHARIIAPLLTEAAKRMRAELKAHFYLYVPRDKTLFLTSPFQGWDRARAAFPSSEYDTKEAGYCLALGRATACVFHSMGVLEHGLKALAAEFSVPTNHKAWGDIIPQIENGIKRIPRATNKPKDWREHQKFCAEAAAQFMHLKNAWRNHTAHARVKYTEEEAEAIYRHVRDFMQHLSKRLREPQHA